MFKDLALYGLLAAIIIALSAPLWLLVIPLAATISAAIRHTRNDS